MTQNFTNFSNKFHSVWGFWPNRFYCEVTGKPIGEMLDEEYDSIILSLGNDFESAIDDFALRALASMRPSLKWNVTRDTTLSEMVKSDPLETMAYLLNRLFTERKEKEQWMRTRTNRIILWEKLAFANCTMTLEGEGRNEAFDSLMIMLLEIEAKLNLLSESVPFNISDIFNADPATLFETLVAKLTKWHTIRIKDHARAEADARFFASNPGAKRAYFESWFAKEPTKAEAKRQAKDKKEGELDQLFRFVEQQMHETNTTPDKADIDAAVAPVVKAKPTGKMPTVFMIKRVNNA